MKCYQNQIYPLTLVISDNIEDISEYYEDFDHEELKPHNNNEATTYPLYRKEGGYAAIGIVFNVPITARLMCHEASHATFMSLELFCHIPHNDDTDECYAYYQGWVGDCIDDFKQTMLNENKE